METFPDQPLVARTEHGKAVADHDPVDSGVIDHAALPPRLAHHVGEMAGARHRKSHRVDSREHVEIDEAVVERCDQRIGHRMRKPHQIAVVPRRIDDNEIVRVFDRIDGGSKFAELRGLIFGNQRTVGARDTVM